MEQHALELLHIAIWLLIVIGGSLLTLGLYFVRQFVMRMDKQDHALENIRALLASEVQKLREMAHNLDKRVIWLESTCMNTHGGPQNRRYNDNPTGGQG